MQPDGAEQEVLSRLIEWAQAREGIRVVLLTSSRVNPQAPRDRLSDYDVQLYVSDPGLYAQDAQWLTAFGEVMVRFFDQGERYGLTSYNRLVLYEDGTKIDFILSPIELLKQIVQEGQLPDNLDVGYRVLVDKDQLAATLPPPTYTAHIPMKPSEEEFLALVEEFWWETTYVAKNLWRDELLPARYNLDSVIKHDLLRRLLEWRVELEAGWSWKPGALGRGLKKRLPPDLWAELETTFAGPEVEENWVALFRTAELFRRAAQHVASGLGYQYPQRMDDQVMAYLQELRQLDQDLP